MAPPNQLSKRKDAGTPSKAALRHTLWFPVQKGGVLVPWVTIELIPLSPVTSKRHRGRAIEAFAQTSGAGWRAKVTESRFLSEYFHYWEMPRT